VGGGKEVLNSPHALKDSRELPIYGS